MYDWINIFVLRDGVYRFINLLVSIWLDIGKVWVIIIFCIIVGLYSVERYVFGLDLIFIE